MRRTLLNFTLLLLLPFCATAQKARFKFFTTADGLAENEVKSIAQNDQGFMWLLNGTKLMRFDGRNFLAHPLPAGMLKPSDQITNVSCYQDSLLLIYTRKQVVLLNPRSGKSENFSLPELNGKHYIPNLYAEVGSDNILIVALQNGDPNDKTFWYFRNKKFEQVDIFWDKNWENYPSLAIGSPDGETCLLTAYGCFFSGKSGKRTVNYPFQSTIPPIPWTAAFETDGSVLAIIDSYFYRVSQSGNALLPHPVNRLLGNIRRQYRHFLTEADGSLWACGADKTLFYYDAALDTLFDFRQELETLIPYSCDFHAFQRDESGVIWVATQMGLLKVVPQTKIFDTYFAGLGPNKTYFSFRGMTEDEAGMVYGGYYTGGAKIDPEKKREYPDAFPLAYLPFGLHMEGNQLWLNTGPVWNTTSKTLTVVPGSVWGEDGGVFAKDKKGVLWRTYHYSLYRLEQRPDGVAQWVEVQRLPGGSLWSPDVMHAGQQSERIWIGLGEQLFAWSAQTKQLKRYGPEELGQPLSRIMAIYEDKQGGIWLGTDKGLIFFNPATGKSGGYSMMDGLPNDFICGILPEGDSCLWLSTNHGLSRFTVQEESFINFFKEDGLTDNEFNRASYMKARNGRMFFGGVKGVNAFFPQELMRAYRRKNEAAHLQLTIFECTDERQDTLVREINFSQHPEIHIYHWERSFSFEYALTDYVNPEEIQYSYLMEGYEEVWSAPSRFNFTRFSSLPSGTYTFRVKARDSRGQWHPKQLAVRVVVHPPWWATWWAYVLYGVLLIAITYFLLRYELNRQRLRHSLDLEILEAKRLKELDSFKTRLYANITHEFRTPLTVILGVAGQMEQNPDAPAGEGPTLIRRNSSNLLSLINQMLDLSKLDSNRMPVSLIQGDITRFVKYIAESFHSMAGVRGLRVTLHSDPESILMDYDPGKMQQIISNLLSNAIKFTPSGGRVEVQLRVRNESGTDQLLDITVRDTGIGIPPEQLPHVFDRFYQADNSNTRKGEGSGIGLALTQELVRLFGGTITATSTPGEGSAFTVCLPIRREAPVDHTDAIPEGLLEISAVPDHPDRNETGGILALQQEDLPLLLLVEDNPDVLTYLIRCLEPQYRIATAANGQVGIEKALELVPDIIISDVMMPEKDGFEVCETLKEDQRTSHIPIVLLTARATVEDRITGLRRGADAYMAKPFHQDELLVQVENLLESRSRLQEHFRLLDTPALARSGTGEQVEDAFLLKLRQFIEADLSNAGLSIDDVCRHMAMSRMQLHRKIKALTDRSTALYIRAVRLQNARRLLLETEMNISEVAYATGFDDPKYFSRVYSEEFGMTPTETRANSN